MRVYPSERTGYLMDGGPDYLNDDYYKTSYSKAEIRAYLRRVKDCIKAGRFIVQNNDGGDYEGRQKNSDFMNKYGLFTRERQQEIFTCSAFKGSCIKLAAALARCGFTSSTTVPRVTKQPMS